MELQLRGHAVVKITTSSGKIISGAPGEFKKELGGRMSDRLIVMEPGETRTF